MSLPQARKHTLEFFGVFSFFLVLLLLIFAEIIFGDKIFIRRDMARYWYPMWNFAIDSLQSGALPLWNPFVFGGTSFLSNIQSCVFYPPTIILHVFGAVKGTGLYVIVHLALSGTFTFLWMRGWSIGFWGSLFAGLGYALCGFTLSTINLTITLCSITYFPLVLFLYRNVIRKPEDTRWVFFTIGSLMLMFLAGEPVIVYATILVLVIFSLFKFAETASITHKLPLHILTRISMIVFLLALLVSFQVLPFFEKVSLTDRTIMTMDHAMRWSVPAHHLLGLFMPYIPDLNLMHLNYWERQSWVDNYYIGIVLLIFVGFAASKPKDRRFHLLIALALLGLVLTLGRHTPLYRIFYYLVPFANMLRYPIKFFFILTFALACLGGLGLDHYLRSLTHKSNRLRSCMFLGLGLGVASLLWILYHLAPWDYRDGRVQAWITGLFMAQGFSEGQMTQFKELIRVASFNLSQGLGLALVTFILLYIFSRKRVHHELTGLSFILLLTLDLSLANTGYEPTLPRDHYMKPTPNILRLQKDTGLFRVMASPPVAWLAIMPPENDAGRRDYATKERLIANNMMDYGIQTFLGYDSFEPSDFVIYHNRLKMVSDPSQTRLLDIANIKYIVSDKPVERIAENFVRVNDSEIAHLYENKNVLPRAFLVKHAEALSNNREILRKVQTSDFRPEEKVYVLSEDAKGPVKNPYDDTSGTSMSRENVVITHYGHEEVRLEVRSSEAQWLYLADAFEKNWHAEVNGEKAPLYKANVMFRAIPVPGGQSRVRFFYRPLSFYTGSAIALFTLLGIMIFWFFRRRKTPFQFDQLNIK